MKAPADSTHQTAKCATCLAIAATGALSLAHAFAMIAAQVTASAVNSALSEHYMLHDAPAADAYTLLVPH